MKIEKSNVLETYLAAYRDSIVAEQIENGAILSFPLHLASGHRIELTVSEIGKDRRIISDSGRTLGEVQAAGYSLTPRMIERIERVAGSSGLRLVDGFLILDCSTKDLGATIQRFIEAAKTIGDVYLVHKQKEPHDRTLISQVADILQSMGLHISFDQKVAGELESHPFDILALPNGRNGLAVSVLSSQNTHSLAQIWGFKCEDIRRGKWYKKSRSKLALVYDIRDKIWSEASKAILGSRADAAIPSNEMEALRDI